ncbi:hypothetical protein HERIO_270 [Hepatospora eriocheir]|uniref:Uncharacterized protein n=1 Tax=Hepatospora eriocheir TaxID=1081669 RepID=A0A1X0QDU8_9MICR|nr:hypothetical protein HERIO_270 [Hepatospora eriocheir]
MRILKILLIEASKVEFENPQITPKPDRDFITNRMNLEKFIKENESNDLINELNNSKLGKLENTNQLENNTNQLENSTNQLENNTKTKNNTKILETNKVEKKTDSTKSLILMLIFFILASIVSYQLGKKVQNERCRNNID